MNIFFRDILKKLSIVVLLIYNNLLYSSSLNIVVFSYNRPMQLYAFLESLERHSSDYENITVIYKTGSKKYDDGYEIVKNDFPGVQWYKQHQSPINDFKELTLKAIDFDNEDYIAFAVDDIIITRDIVFKDIINLLEETSAHGFYLRLGSHITHCYSENRKTGTPPFISVHDNVRAWKFKDGAGDWGYPHTVDMTVYKKAPLKKLFNSLTFNNPNTLEGNWAMIPPSEPLGLCYADAALVNCPLNIVQTTYNNRHSNAFSAKELLDLFLKGYKIDIARLEGIYNNSPHMDYRPHFIPR